MNKILTLLLVLAGALGAPGVLAEASAPAPVTVTVTADGEKTDYNLADAESAKAYVDAYAANVQNDGEFRAHEAKALETVRTVEPLFGTWWAIFPPLLAIVLALITKEVYSSLFVGIVSGGILYAIKPLTKRT